MSRSLLLILALLLVSSTDAVRASSPSEAGDELQGLREANRALEEELKLAARPQIYLVLDLAQGVLLIKGRGLDLYRLPLLGWQVSNQERLGQPFRLQTRPPLSRPKLTPGEDPSETVIDLEDMPAEYVLVFDPGLWIAVAPPVMQQPWLWAQSRVREWTSYVRAPQGAVQLRLTLGTHDARSLAWSVVEGMPLIIRRSMK